MTRIVQITEGDLTSEALRSKAEEIAERRRTSLTTDTWRVEFRGRDVLKRFVSREVKIVRYEVFRDLILARMREADFQPSNMAEILTKIMDD